MAVSCNVKLCKVCKVESYVVHKARIQGHAYSCSVECFEKRKEIKKNRVSYEHGIAGKYTRDLNEKKYKSEQAFCEVLKTNGIKDFKQNRKIGPFYADFLCNNRKLIIEVDGSFHDTEEQQKRDRQKDKLYQACGFTLFRVKYPFEDAELARVVAEIKTISKNNKAYRRIEGRRKAAKTFAFNKKQKKLAKLGMNVISSPQIKELTNEPTDYS